jgi:2-oxoglutarate ferredoxin oxidoreductase subunit beta
MATDAGELRRVSKTPELLLSTQHSLCPGCGEPLVLRTVLEILVELGLRDRTICVCGIGCYTAFPALIDVDVLQALHGRAPSVATGAKRVLPDRFVWTLQGDGDMVNEGLQEIIHAAARGEKFTAVLLNNGVFGETGGHMTATSVLGQRTKTTMETGRVAEVHGYPIRIADLLAQVDGAAYVARGSVHTPGAIRWTKQILTEAFQVQLEAKGFSFVEVLTMCPTDWYVEPTETPQWVERHFTGPYPPGVLKRPSA